MLEENSLQGINIAKYRILLKDNNEKTTMWLGHNNITIIVLNGQNVTYHHRWIVPLLIRACSIWVDAVIDDLERCQANSLHGAEVGLPEPACLRTKGTDFLKYTHTNKNGLGGAQKQKHKTY